MKIIIIGAGKLGYKLAESLLNYDIDVTVLDSNPHVIERVHDGLDVLGITANGIDIELLRSLNIETYDLLVATTDSDETNTIICTIAKKFGCKRTIARIRNPEYSKQLDFIKSKLGVDYVVNPELATAGEISRYLLKNYIFYSGSFAMGKVLMIDSKVNNFEGFSEKKIKNLKNMDNLLIVAIVRNGNIIIPNGSTQLLETDIIYIVGKAMDINKLGQKYNLNVKRTSMKNVMILGGGKIGYYLAKQLMAAHIQVSIIEENSERCEYLSEKLDNALIINGNGTDINLLEEENLSSMDAFIGVTGYDEQNLLMALMAKQLGVNKVVAKISKPNYVKIIDRLGIDVALNPINITASNIIKFIQGDKIVSLSLLLDGQAEIMEVIVNKELTICNKKISELNLPRDIIICSIVHEGVVNIPNGQTLIRENDHLVILCLSEDVPILNSFINPKKEGLFH